MSAQNLIDTLREIGYPKADQLDPHALEWSLENEPAAAFLNWLCSSVSKENVLTQEELDLFEHIKESGNVLMSPQLDEALSVVTEENSTADLTIDDVEQLKATLAKAKSQKEALAARCNKLSVHLLAVQNKTRHLEEAEVHASKSCRQTTDKCHTQNILISEALQRLSESVDKLISLYSPKEPNSSYEVQTDKVSFLSQMDLSGLLTAVEKFSQDLTAFTKKQFFEGIGELAGDRDASQFDLLDISSPDNIHLEGKEKDSFIDDCLEFSHLHNMFSKSECDRINALVCAKKALSAVHEAKSVLHTLKSNHFPNSPTEISRLQHTVEQNIEAVKAEAAPLVSSLPDLIRELGSLQGTEILTGDYDLKLKRQDYFTKNQDKVINHLIDQRARNEYLVMLFDLETQCHRRTHHLLSAAGRVLESHLHEWQQRMKDLEDPELSGKKFERGVVDIRDTSTACLFQLLGNDKSEKMLYLPKQKVVEAAERMQQQYHGTKSSDQTMDEEYLTKAEQLENQISRFKSLLYKGSSTSAGQLSLTPCDVQDAMVALTAKIESLEEELSQVISKFNNKKTILKNNVLQQKERELFVLFHTNPSRLQYVVNGLADRLKAQEIQESTT